MVMYVHKRNNFPTSPLPLLLAVDEFAENEIL